MKPKGPFLNIRFHGGKRTCILKNIFFSPSFSVVPPEEENNLLQKKKSSRCYLNMLIFPHSGPLLLSLVFRRRSYISTDPFWYHIMFWDNS